MRPRRPALRRVGLALGLIAGIAGIGAAGARQDSARDQLAAMTAAREALAHTESTLGRAADELDAQIVAQEAMLDATDQRRADVVAITEDRRRSIETEHAMVQGLDAQYQDTAAQLDDLGRRLGLQALAIAPLRRCVDGVATAVDAVADGDRAAAVTALGRTAEDCATVRGGGSSATPAFPFDFPDPHIVWSGSRWVAFATNSTGGAVQMISSADLADWRVDGNALVGLPGWARPGATWAPAVIDAGGRWLLYYTVREDATGIQCISVATADVASGPYRDDSTAPLVCERDEGGSIDPQPVRDGAGGLVLWWKTELDTVGGRAELRAAPLDATGTVVTAPPSILLRAEQAWEGATIEAPAALSVGGTVDLLYSANSWATSRYAVGIARCTSALGPCVRRSTEPILTSAGSMVGPGGLSVFGTGATARIAFHAWLGSDVGYPHNRYLHLGTISATDGRLTIAAG